jgi:hypothetical protein
MLDPYPCLSLWQLLPEHLAGKAQDAAGVILYARSGRSTDKVKDQVTYPIVVAMLGAPHVNTASTLSYESAETFALFWLDFCADALNRAVPFCF